jgi:GTP-binding protein
MKGCLPSVAIIGRPNVGKSALFNRIAGRKISIVHDQPGITRDRISALCSHSNRPFMLSDTGGIAGAGELELVADVQRVAGEAIRESDVLIFVVDGKAGLSPIDGDIARMVRKSGKLAILVVNKIDDPQHESMAADFDSLGFDQSLSVSAEHNRGVSELLEAIDAVVAGIVDSGHAKPETRPAGVTAPGYNQIRIAIVGRPNVGKSSLINSIVRGQHAIVSELPGTTRDAIDIFYQSNGKRFTFIDTAGIRRRRKHSSSVEVFSVIRAERSIRRADVCVLIVDLSAGITAQDKRIAGLIQEARKPCIVVLNKWDLFKLATGRVRPTGGPRRNEKAVLTALVKRARETLFFLDYAPILVASALTHENVDRLFRLIQKLRAASLRRIGTGILNRLLRAAFAANPPPIRKGRRLRLFYATQKTRNENRQSEIRPGAALDGRIVSPEFVLFVNDPSLLTQNYQRYLKGRIREVEPYVGLPISLTLRPRNLKL